MDIIIKILEVLSIPVISIGSLYLIFFINKLYKITISRILLKYIASDINKWAKMQDDMPVNYLFCKIIKDALASSRKKEKIELFSLCKAYNWTSINAKYESDLKKHSLSEFSKPLRNYGFIDNAPLYYNTIENVFIYAILYLTSTRDTVFQRDDALKTLNYCLQRVSHKNLLMKHIIEHFEDKVWFADKNIFIKKMSVNEFNEYLKTI